MVARVLAVLAAVAMVAGALVVRDRMDETGERTSTTLRLVCATELQAVCDALAGRNGSKVETKVEPAAVTADTLTELAPGKRPPLDGWLVTAPWPAIVEGARSRQATGSILTSGAVLARSPVTLAVRNDRHSLLFAHCKGEPGWKCLGDVAGKPWRELAGGQTVPGQVTFGRPPTSGVAGLTIMGAAMTAFFDPRSDLSSSDLDDDAFQSWLSRLEAAIPTRPASPIEQMLQRPTAFDAVGALEAEAGPQVLTARDPKPVLLYPSPVVTADVVLGVTGGRASELLAELLSGETGHLALAGAGWRVDGEKPIPGIRTEVSLPPTSNLPDPGVLDALRERISG